MILHLQAKKREKERKIEDNNNKLIEVASTLSSSATKYCQIGRTDR